MQFLAVEEDEEGEHSGPIKHNLKRTASSISRKFKDLKFLVTHGKMPAMETDDDAFARCCQHPTRILPRMHCHKPCGCLTGQRCLALFWIWSLRCIMS